MIKAYREDSVKRGEGDIYFLSFAQLKNRFIKYLLKLYFWETSTYNMLKYYMKS